MSLRLPLCIALAGILALEGSHAAAPPEGVRPLPDGVKAVWSADRAHCDSTATRERLCINGLWRWQPAGPETEEVPRGRWGWFKVPGPWPGITDYMQKDCQTVHTHPDWSGTRLADVNAAWYEREVGLPAGWTGRRITLQVAYLNSFAAVYLDGKRVGDLQFPGGELDITAGCRPGSRHVLSLRVEAFPLEAVLLSYSDSNAAREVKGSVARRGLCGDVFLVAEPSGARLGEVTVSTSVRRWTITAGASLRELQAGARYVLEARMRDGGRTVRRFKSQPFTASEVRDGRISFTKGWHPAKLWDTHTPGNTYELGLSLLDASNTLLDEAHPVRFGFRELWIDGRDFYLNGTRIFLSTVPLDNAQVGAALATYEAARESLSRLRSFGIDLVYTHNYDCRPGSHLSFEEILDAADDVGMLVALSQPHFADYDWEGADADRTNGYARHAAFYVGVARNHPSVVLYSMSHNATGYNEDMNPDQIDGIHEERSQWSRRNARKALRAEAIVKSLDPHRIVYHHSSGNLGSMHTSNFYPNFVPIQEMSDWFEHWATEGVKPFFACEYGAPFTWDWSMYRGWFRGSRSFGSARVPWEFCLAEWNAQFLGDAAFGISEEERRNLRWEATRFRDGTLWHRWDYPHRLGSRDFDERYPVLAAYLTDNWRAFRTWGVSAISPWEHGVLWKMRPGLDRNRRVELSTDWERLQRPGFSPDYLEERYERRDLAYERSDWIATPAAEALYRNNRPLLAYFAGDPSRLTAKDHNFRAGEAVTKTIVVINDSRVPVICDASWSLDLPRPVEGRTAVHVETGQQARIPLEVALPPDLPPGSVELRLEACFRAVGETTTVPEEIQKDRFLLHVLPPVPSPVVTGRIALFDPVGETERLLTRVGVSFQSIDAGADLSGYDALIIGKAALTVDGPAPDASGVRDGLKVLLFEQSGEALEKRLGFRVAEYGLRRVFRRVPEHPLLAGLADGHLRDWRGKSTLLPPRLAYEPSDRYNGAPAVRWCGLEVPRLWRCGHRGSVASAVIEKPARGDFLPILDGGYSLQYSPLLEYREGRGMMLFCQMDVTGRTVEDPAAARLASNLLAYVLSPTPWRPVPDREPLYLGNRAGRRHLEHAGIDCHRWEGDDLRREQVLIVGRGGGQVLLERKPAVVRWLEAGGHLLALELDAAELNPVLSEPVATTRREHIAAFFEPPGPDSLLLGVGPADVHNRAPRELPLVSAGARIIGNGVLARLDRANVVFCQLEPSSVSRALGARPSLGVSDGDAAEGTRSALVNLGTLPWAQLAQKIPAGAVGKSYTLSVRVKAIDDPVRLRLEVERAARPWDRVVRGEEVDVGPEEWSELQVRFTVGQPCPEGWSVYLHCGQEGARFRADAFRLEEGEHLRGDADARGADVSGSNLLSHAGFEEGAGPWRLGSSTQQHNLRRTYRRASFLVARILANLGVRAGTPILHRFSTPVARPGPGEPSPPGRWTSGLYVDEPQEWDDPYRFFRW